MSYSPDDVREMVETMDEMEEKLRAMQGMLETLTSPPFAVSIVAGITKKRVKVLNHDGQMEILAAPHDGTQVTIGDMVLRSAKTGQIVEVSKPEIRYGNYCTVTDDNENSYHCMVEVNGQQRSVMKGFAGKEVQVGSQVILDGSSSIIIHDMGRPTSDFKTERTDNVSWDDIGGLQDAKEKLKESVEYPFEFANIYKRFGRKPASGILLYGPPGCGKTMLAKAVANSLRGRMGGDAGSNFIYVKGPEILERWVGAAEANIRHLFTMAREHYEEHGYPAIVFIDEADAILGRRGSGVSSDMERTIVPQFLSEMSGFEESGAITLLATNRADVLDPAVVRDGRIDHKIRIGRPGKSASKEIVQLHLKNVPCESRRDRMASVAIDSLSDGHILYNITMEDGETQQFCLKHIVSGAMLAGIANKASSRAMGREIKCQGKKRHEVTEKDMEEAVKETFVQNYHLNHDEAIEDFVSETGKEVVSLARPR